MSADQAARAGDGKAQAMADAAHKAVQSFLDLVADNESYGIEEYSRLSKQHSEAVVFAINNLRDLAAAPAVSAPEPLPDGWKFNHAQQQTDEDGPVAGTWEIGCLDDEDSAFYPILVLDTWLYSQEEAAEPLARAILARLAAPGFQAPATGEQP